MNQFTRRDFIRIGSLGVAGLMFPFSLSAAEAEEPYITCYYQFTKKSLSVLSGPNGLPNGKNYLHIFSQSSPGIKAHPESAKAVHACGSSFKYAPAFDLHKYEGWLNAPEEQLKKWAWEFRELALDPKEPADYFAFNEMPSYGATNSQMQKQVALLLKYLYKGPDGKILPGVFYFTERNTNTASWVEDTNGFWKAVDETSHLVVAEHYHNYEFVVSKKLSEMTSHLFKFAEWMLKSGDEARANIAKKKFCVLHSTYYGPKQTGWVGLQTDKYTLQDLEKYFHAAMKATRASELGKKRVAFGPLATSELNQEMYTVLNSVLNKFLPR